MNSPILNKKHLENNKPFWEYFFFFFHPLSPNPYIEIYVWSYDNPIVLPCRFVYHVETILRNCKYSSPYYADIPKESLNNNNKPFLISSKSNLIESGFTTTPKEAIKRIRTKIFEQIDKNKKCEKAFLDCYKKACREITQLLRNNQRIHLKYEI